MKYHLVKTKQHTQTRDQVNTHQPFSPEIELCCRNQKRKKESDAWFACEETPGL